MFFAVLLRLIALSSSHLPLIVTLNSSHRLSQSICFAMLMMRMRSFMLMKNYYCALSRILRIMKVPYMPGVSGHYGHIIIIYRDYREILQIKTLQILCTKQPQPLSPQTRQLMPAPQLLPSAWNSFPQNTYCRWSSEA